MGYASLCYLYQFTTILLPCTRCSPRGVGNDTFASMELFPVVFLPTSPMWVAAMALGRLWNWIPVIYSWGCCGHAAINSLALVSLPKIRHIHFESVVDPRIVERISKAHFHQERLVKEIGYINFLLSSWSEFYLHVIFNMWFSLQMLYIVLT